MTQRIPELEFLSLVHDYSTYCQSVCRCRCCCCCCLRRFFVGFVDEGNTILIRLLFGAPRSTKSLYRHIPQWNPKALTAQFATLLSNSSLMKLWKRRLDTRSVASNDSQQSCRHRSCRSNDRTVSRHDRHCPNSATPTAIQNPVVSTAHCME